MKNNYHPHFVFERCRLISQARLWLRGRSHLLIKSNDMFLAPSCGQTLSTLLINTIQLRGRQLRETKNIWVNVLLHDARVETRDDALRLS